MIQARTPRELRERKALTQEALAEAADVNPATVYRLEKGLRTSAETRIRIARVLGVPVEELYVVHSDDSATDGVVRG